MSIFRGVVVFSEADVSAGFAVEIALGHGDGAVADVLLDGAEIGAGLVGGEGERWVADRVEMEIVREAREAEPVFEIMGDGVRVKQRERQRAGERGEEPFDVGEDLRGDVDGLERIVAAF